MRGKIVILIATLGLAQIMIAQTPIADSVKLDSTTLVAIAKLEDGFKKDSTGIMDAAKKAVQGKRAKLDKSIQKLIGDVSVKKQEKAVQAEVDQTSVIPTVQPIEITENKSKTQSSIDRKPLLEKLRDTKELPNVKHFIDNLIVSDDSVRNYVRILPVLKRIDADLNLLSAYRDSTLRCFIEGVEGVKLADDVLNKSFNKNERNLAKLTLVPGKFPAKVHRHQAEALLEALGLYYLATSNMLDLIDEVKKAYTAYCDSVATEKQRSEAQIQIKESMEFEARVDNFRQIPYMWEMYCKINKMVLAYNVDHSYNIADFDMELLDEFKQELDNSRAKK